MRILFIGLMLVCVSAWGQGAVGTATSSPATLSNGQLAYPSYDLSNNLRVTQSTSPSSPLNTVGTPAAQTNSANTITTGGTFQTISAASSTRKSFEFQNICTKAGNCTATTDNCYLFIAASGTPTTANSIVVGPGQAYLRSTGSIPSNAIQATCDSNGDHYYLAVQ